MVYHSKTWVCFYLHILNIDQKIILVEAGNKSWVWRDICWLKTFPAQTLFVFYLLTFSFDWLHCLPLVFSLTLLFSVILFFSLGGHWRWHFSFSSVVASIVLSVTSKAISGDRVRTGDYVLKSGDILKRERVGKWHFVKETWNYIFQLFIPPPARREKE